MLLNYQEKNLSVDSMAGIQESKFISKAPRVPVNAGWGFRDAVSCIIYVRAYEHKIG